MVQIEKGKIPIRIDTAEYIILFFSFKSLYSSTVTALTAIREIPIVLVKKARLNNNDAINRNRIFFLSKK